jgi:hypothetical protein
MIEAKKKAAEEVSIGLSENWLPEAYRTRASDSLI